MSRIPNTPKTSKVDAPTHRNWMAGAAYTIDNPILRLRTAAASCFFGEPMYYHRDGGDDRKGASRPAHALTDDDLKHLRASLDATDPQEWRGLTPAEMMERAIDAALDHDADAALAEAVRLRTEDNIRTTPQVILVRAAHHAKVRGTSLLAKYLPQIVQRADEPVVILSYHEWRYKNKALPNGLKRALARRLSLFKEYELAKYRGEGKDTKLVDVVNLVRPKHNDAISKLVKGTLTMTDQSWEAILSAEKASKDTWIKAIGVMGHMALLRNLRNFLDHDVPYTAYLPKLLETAEKGRQLPFRYFSAYKAVEGHARVSPPVLDGIESCLMTSLKELPKFPGRVMSLCDNSGSAQGATTSSLGTMKINEIANLTGVLTGYCADEGYVGVFGDRLEPVAIRKKASVFDQLKQANKLAKSIGEGTENGVWLFWEQAIREKEQWDYVFIYSDQQAGTGGLYGTDMNAYRNYLWKGSRHIDVAKLIADYRKKVNPKVTVFLVQVAGYQDTLVPTNFKRTHILGGWGDGILRYARAMADIADATAQPAAAAAQQ